MNVQRLLNVILILGLFQIPLLAQDEITEEPEEDKKGVKFGVGLSGSTRGVGLDVGIGLSQKFQFRLGGTYFQFDQDFQFDFDGQPFDVSADVDMRSLQLLADYHPFNGSSFRLTGGLAYHINERYSMQGAYAGDEVFSLGEIVIEGDDVGTLGIDVAYERLAPYAALGFGRAVPTGRVNFSFELGSYYNSSPDVTINATKMLSGTSSQSAQMEENMQDYRFYPVMMFRLGFKI